MPAGVWLVAALVASQGSREPGVSVTWTSPPGCPRQAALEEDVESLLGRRLDAPFDRWVDVRATVKGVNGAFTLVITGDGSSGPFRRELEDASCTALAQAAALIVALAVDPSMGEEASSPPPSPPPPPPPPAAPPAAPAPRSPPPPPPSAKLPFGIPWPRLGLFAGGVAAGGARPTVGPGILAGGAIFWRYFRVEGHAAYWFREAALIGRGSADVSLISVSGRACPTIPAWIFEVPLCLGLEGGQLRVDPVEIPGAEPSRTFWGAAVFSGGVAWAPLDPLAVRLQGEAFVSVFRPSYELASAGEAYRPSLFGGRGSLTLEVRFF